MESVNKEKAAELLKKSAGVGETGNDIDMASKSSKLPYVVLIDKPEEKLQIVGVIPKNGNTLLKGKMTCVVLQDGVPMIDETSNVLISTSQIIAAPDHKVMTPLQNYDINITENDLKKAHERAKDFVVERQTYNDAVGISIERAVDVIVSEAVSRAILTEAQGKNVEVKEVKKPAYLIDKAASVVMIEASEFPKLLNELAIGYSTRQLCKKIATYEVISGKTVMRRQNGRYAYNLTGNVRYYCFYIGDKVKDVEEVS